jgi:DNA-binding response OmpR family regulator
MSDCEDGIGWRFGPAPYELYVHHKALMIGGKIVPLTEIEMSLLIAAAKRGGEYVTKDEFIQTIWPGGDIGEEVLPMHFRRLRKKIGNDIIDTVRGIGYRLSSKPDV